MSRYSEAHLARRAAEERYSELATGLDRRSLKIAGVEEEVERARDVEKQAIELDGTLSGPELARRINRQIILHGSVTFVKRRL